MGQIVGGGVMSDIAEMISQTVEGLYVGYCLDDFDLSAWRAKWQRAGK